MTNTNTPRQADTDFLGLAPFLRQNLAGIDLQPVAQQLLAKLATQADNALLWMNLSTIMLCLGQRDLGLSMQAEALKLQSIYFLPASQQPAKLKLLLLMIPGDLAANTPLDCLLENSDIELIYYYVSLDDQPLALAIPEHDVAMVAISEDDESLTVLTRLQAGMANWPKPVINPAQCIPVVGRCRAAQTLQRISGLQAPLVHRLNRSLLENMARGKINLAQVLPGCQFPLIIRPTGSHAGRDLDKLDSTEALTAYLAKVKQDDFFLSKFIDYRNADGLYRKYRITLIAGEAYICHLAVSEHWLIHYVNAGMYLDAQKRDEEAAFMAGFSDFTQRHQAAFTAIYQRTRLAYLGIDCAETDKGELLIFEIDHAMVVHAMDSEQLFPHKKFYMQKLQDAFRSLLFGLAEQTDKPI